MAFQSALMKVLVMASAVAALPSPQITKIVDNINEKGPYIGVVIPNTFEMNPLLQSSEFNYSALFPTVDLQGRRFHIGTIGDQNVILVMTGLAMTNAGITTELLLSFFTVKGIVHYGIAGNADPSLHIGDVTIPRYWAHTGLWNWQRYGDGPEDELALEGNGDYTREFGFLHFASFQNSSESKPADNLLNNVWFQPEEIFPVTGTPEVRQHAFWVPVDDSYYRISESLQMALELESCVNATTCLSHAPRVVRVERGCSANVYLDNAAYRSFIRAKFNVTAVDKEGAAVALVSAAQGVPFIAIRALSDLAGGGSAESNEASTFASLAAQNAVTVVSQFVKLLSTESSILSSRSDQ